MKLEHQVVGLDLAKQLKELGVPQESYFYWKTDEDREMGTSDAYLVAGNSRYYTSKGTIECSAFTVAELGSLIAKKTKSNRWVTTFHPRGNREVVRISDAYAARWKGEGETEADARAKMLIYLLKNGLIKL